MSLADVGFACNIQLTVDTIDGPMEEPPMEDHDGPGNRRSHSGQQRHTETAGPKALPHFQQTLPPPVGHTFYETANSKARKKR